MTTRSARHSETSWRSSALGGLFTHVTNLYGQWKLSQFTQHYLNKWHHILKGNQNMSYTGNEIPPEQDLRNTQQHLVLAQS